MTAACGVGATVAAVALIAVIADGPQPSRVIDALLRRWSRCWLRPAGVRLRVAGGEHVRPGVAYVVVVNHQSNLDPMVVIDVLGIPVRFLAMRELFDLPVLGMALRRLGMVEVDRADPNGTSIAEGVRRALAAGTSVVIFPEGGTSGDGVVGRFRPGAFRYAIANGAPVLPVTVVGSRDVWPTDRNAIRPGVIDVVIDEPVPTTGLGTGDVPALQERVRDTIAANVERSLRER